MLDIRIMGTLWEQLEPAIEIDLEGREATVADLIARLGIDQTEVGIVIIDGRQSRPDAILPANGRVYIFPPMFGG